MPPERRAGVMVRIGGEARFIPVATALRVAPMPRVTPVPGGPPELVGVALHEGTIVPVVAIGPARAEMIVCQYGGDLVGLVGGEAVQTGVFDVVEGVAAPTLDVGAIYAAVQSASRPGRWAG